MIEKLDKLSPSPLYIQLAEIIEGAINDGIYPQGSKIPSEQQLMKTYGISRITVRQTMDHLISKGKIIRKQGIGTFVTKEVITQTIVDFIDFYPSLLSKFDNLEAKILEYENVLPNAEEKKILQLSDGEVILNYIRQFYIKKTVIGICQACIPFDIAKHWSKEEFSEKNSIRLIQESAGVKLKDSHVTIRSVIAKPKIAEHLKISKGGPVLELRRTTYSINQRPVEYTIFNFRGDLYELNTKIAVGDSSMLQLSER
ncbi:GntR family transcriptional regulator [Desulforamulus aeronauticus]|uniref:Transcriptional regulator, GntR family n=1 Tax=Desulforamulus aeronauticus DSM 10349 TaxID=1121421 RepID=A0A1M6NGY9_9FIRM|nr:GntR family transcriptional regulator [Desulforamulus aeronauticus]SHJ94959.1 transcriptional regulator, GntR family [Desulforamulus aeronauticus DSM 10349]